MAKAPLKFQSLSELKPFYEKLKLHQVKPIDYTRTVQELYETASDLRKNGHEEEAYIMIMKMLSLIAYIQSTKEYQNNREYFKVMIGEFFFKGVQLAEELNKSLKQRYGECTPEKQILPDEIKTSSTDVATFHDMSSNSLPDNFISSANFHTKLKDHDIEILIVDIRPKADFLAKRIIHEASDFVFMCNVPENCINLGYSANKIKNSITSDMVEFWDKRGHVDQVILLDNNTSSENLETSSKLCILKSIMEEWDPNTKYKNPILILDNGIEGLEDFFPWIILGSNIITQKEVDPVTQISWQDYPSLEIDDKPKFDRVSKPNLTIQKDPIKPNVDRSLKDRALKNYEDKKNDKINKMVQIIRDDDFEQSLKASRSNMENGIEHKLIINDSCGVQSEIATVLKEKDKQEINLNKHNDDEIMDSDMDPPKSLKTNHINEANVFKNILDTGKKKEKNIPAAPAVPSFNRSTKPNKQIRNFDEVYGEVPPGLTGLKNLGNTCYMNSILQCISNSKTLKNYLWSRNYKSDLNRDRKTRGRISEEMAALIKHLWCGRYRYIACTDFKNVVGSLKVEYSRFEQHDSHEFLTFLMDWLHDELPNNKCIEPLVECQNGPETAWSNFINKNPSIISYCFYGLQRSVVQCSVCQHDSITYEPFSNLSLNIPETNTTITLNSCIKLYITPEFIDDWKCERCNNSKGASKKTEFCKLPTILIVHLKRFNFEMHSTKKTVNVDFPIDNLRIESINGKKNYSLYGVSNHYGTMEGGHYTAYCKNSETQKWYKYDDHEVSCINEQNIKTKAAYILFYTMLEE